MLCSVCNEKPAVIFVHDASDKDPNHSVGYCIDCAKEKGINPLANTNIDFNNVAEQFEEILQNLSNNIDMQDADYENGENMVPIGAIIGNIFGPNNSQGQANSKNSGNTKRVKVDTKQKEKRKKYLDTFGTNLTNKAKNNQLDAVIGRDKEIRRIIQILNRRTKNNPCLIGEPGVGKTAIAQGLAIAIASGNVPAKLLNKEVYLLDMTAVVAGTQFRGQFEARMKGIIDECKSLGNIILVIDEIHNIIGAGDGENAMNAANILKPSLANGDIQLIGTTTLREYRKYIEKDTALERRFQTVLVEEPNIDRAAEMMYGIKKYYEDFHKVKISNDVIRQAVIMSEKYVHDRYLPDKAIDLIDEACSKINLKNKALFELELIKNELKKVAEEKEDAVSSDSIEDYQKAADLKTKECNLTERMETIEKDLKPSVLTVQDKIGRAHV